MTICKNCKYLWIYGNKLICNSNQPVKYGNSKKECKFYEQGTNFKDFIKKGSKKTSTYRKGW